MWCLLSGAKADTSDTVDVFNIAVCELAGHLPTYSQSNFQPYNINKELTHHLMKYPNVT